LKAPAVTSVLVKALTPIESVLDKILKVWKPGIGDVEGELVSEMGSRLRAPLERWLAHSRRSAEFFISAILRHRRNLLNGCHYEHLLHRDLLLAVRCWTFGAPCARQIQFRLLSLSAAVMNAPLDFNLREHLRAMVSQARRDRIVEPDLEDLVSTVTGLGSSAMSEPLEMDGGMWPDELWYLSRFGQPKEEVTSRVKELFTHFGDDFKRRLLALTRDSERSLRLLATEQLADFASRMRKN